MFCDECDRGYHTFCVGLKRLPIGRWICNDCGKCASCGSTTPGESVLHNVHWKHEYSKPKDENTPPKFLQTLCVKCSRLFRNGDYCPICLKVYSNSNDEVPMICCDDCDRWIHIECDNIDRKQYEEMENKHYSCGICRNIIPEKVNN
ncbi:uncharacterized protein LOC135145818 [Zophobas morio]|uniref:uncharacterized protein LOC135145818 n=1 Tax=Zophobas morio TaxID=2755281 RepID=UPI003083C4A4